MREVRHRYLLGSRDPIQSLTIGCRIWGVHRRRPSPWTINRRSWEHSLRSWRQWFTMCHGEGALGMTRECHWNHQDGPTPTRRIKTLSSREKRRWHTIFCVVSRATYESRSTSLSPCAWRVGLGPVPHLAPWGKLEVVEGLCIGGGALRWSGRASEALTITRSSRLPKWMVVSGAQTMLWPAIRSLVRKTSRTHKAPI
jgi:hypothetical protein